MRSLRISLTALLVLIAGCTSAKMEQGTIFTASTVLAGPAQAPMRDGAVYVTGGKIREVGTAAGIRAAHPDARVIAAPGATILPGLTDAHAHLYGLGLALDIVDLTGTSSFDEVADRVKARSASLAPNEWVEGRGWDQTSWPVREFPTAIALDAAVAGRPA